MSECSRTAHPTDGRTTFAKQAVRAGVVVFVLAIIGNVLVAWSCAALSPLEPDIDDAMLAIQEGRSFAPEPGWLDAIGFRDRSRSVFREGRHYGLGVERREITAAPDLAVSERDGTVSCLIVEPFAFRISAGWPFYSLGADQLHPVLRPGSSPTRWWPRYGIQLARRPTARWRADEPGRILPLKPVWTGFVANTVLLAGVLWLIGYGPLVARRLVRVRSGRCPLCGYPGGATPHCTECGCLLPAPSAQY